MFLDHGFALLNSEAGEGEHTDLVDDMIPVTPGSNLLEVLLQQSSHFCYSVGNIDQLLEPLVSKANIVQDETSNSGTVGWWGRIVDSNNDLKLGEDSSGDSFVSSNEMECSGSLSVETHDLSERLGNDHLESLCDEVSKSKTVLLEISRDETLISGIEEWIKSSSSNNLSDSLPLVKSWVNTSWVVSTGVQQNNGSSGGVAQVFEHSLDVETLGLWVKISVLSDLKSRSSENRVVVSPGGVAHIDWAWSVFNQEIRDHSKSSSSRKSLG